MPNHIKQLEEALAAFLNNPSLRSGARSLYGADTVPYLKWRKEVSRMVAEGISYEYAVEIVGPQPENPYVLTKQEDYGLSR